ncbi:MAG: hypothetical protein AAGE52_00925 [Myxococcota bacterium]
MKLRAAFCSGSSRLQALALGVALAGCGDSAPPPPPPPDASGGLDADRAGPDADLPDANPRGDAAVLPPADLEVVLPYLGPEERVDRSIETEPGMLDVHFSIDTTGSFIGEIDALQQDLSGRIVESLEEEVDDVAFGVSRFEDFPLEPYGVEGDRPFELLAPITTDRTRARSGVARLDQPLGSGGDLPESGFEALYQIATGEGFEAFGIEYIAPFVGDGLGGVGFRDGALHVVVHATDAPSQTPSTYQGPPSRTRDVDDVQDAMGDLNAFVLGVASDDGARPQLEDLALRTGATIPPEAGTCATGINGAPRPPVDGACPLVFDIQPDGTGLSSAIVDAIVGLLGTVRYEEVYGVVLSDRAGFVRAVEAVEAEGDPPPDRIDVRPMDGINDTFLNVRIGTSLRFAIRLRNERIPPATYDQFFRLTVQIVGDGLVLDEVTIRVVVPFGRIDAGLPDAGTDAAVDAEADAAIDAATDATIDAAIDAAVDAGTDAADASEDV